MLSPRLPRPPQHSTDRQAFLRAEAELEVFGWARCPRHPWYGVSVILVLDAPPLCVPPEGAAHVVDWTVAS